MTGLNTVIYLQLVHALYIFLKRVGGLFLRGGLWVIECDQMGPDVSVNMKCSSLNTLTMVNMINTVSEALSGCNMLFGLVFDDQLTFSDHISKTARSCRYALFNIRKTGLLVQALVLSRLDY